MMKFLKKMVTERQYFSILRFIRSSNPAATVTLNGQTGSMSFKSEDKGVYPQHSQHSENTKERTRKES